MAVVRVIAPSTGRQGLPDRHIRASSTSCQLLWPDQLGIQFGDAGGALVGQGGQLGAGGIQIG